MGLSRRLVRVTLFIAMEVWNAKHVVALDEIEVGVVGFLGCDFAFYELV